MTKEEIEKRVKLLEDKNAIAKEHVAELDLELKAATDDKTKKRIVSTKNVIEDGIESRDREIKELKDEAAKPPAPAPKKGSFHW